MRSKNFDKTGEGEQRRFEEEHILKLYLEDSSKPNRHKSYSEPHSQGSLVVDRDESLDKMMRKIIWKWLDFRRSSKSEDPERNLLNCHRSPSSRATPHPLRDAKMGIRLNYDEPSFSSLSAWSILKLGLGSSRLKCSIKEKPRNSEFQMKLSEN